MVINNYFLVHEINFLLIFRSFYLLFVFIINIKSNLYFDILIVSSKFIRQSNFENISILGYH